MPTIITLAVPPDLDPPTAHASYHLTITSSPQSNPPNSHLGWYTTTHHDNRTLIQQRSFASPTLAACWQTDPTDGLFPCVLSSDALHFLTLSRPPTCIPLPRPYDAVYTLGGGGGGHEGGVLLTSRSQSFAFLPRPFHVEEELCCLEGGVDGGVDAPLEIVWTSARAPLFLAHRQSTLVLCTVAVSVAVAVTKTLRIIPWNDQPVPRPTLEHDRATSRWRLTLAGGRWLVMMQSSTGEMFVVQEGGEGGEGRGLDVAMDDSDPGALDEAASASFLSSERRRSAASPNLAGVAAMDDSDADARDVAFSSLSSQGDFEAMMRHVDAGRRRRAAARATSLNVLGGDAPTDDVQKLPFHLAYAVLAERRAEAENVGGALPPPRRQRLDDTRTFEARELLCRWVFIDRLSATRPLDLSLARSPTRSMRPVVLKSQDVGGY